MSNQKNRKWTLFSALILTAAKVILLIHNWTIPCTSLKSVNGSLWPNEQNMKLLIKYTTTRSNVFSLISIWLFSFSQTWFNSPYFYGSSHHDSSNELILFCSIRRSLYGVVNRTQDRVRKPLVAHSSTIARPWDPDLAFYPTFSSSSVKMG